MDKIELGNKVRDITTGFVGIAVVRIEHLDGRVEFGVRGPASSRDPHLPPVQPIPEALLQRVDGGIMVTPMPKRVGFNMVTS